MPRSDYEVLERICNDEKISYIIFEYLAPLIECVVIKIPAPIFTGWNGVYLNDRTPYSTIFNRR